MISCDTYIEQLGVKDEVFQGKNIELARSLFGHILLTPMSRVTACYATDDNGTPGLIRDTFRADNKIELSYNDAFKGGKFITFFSQGIHCDLGYNVTEPREPVTFHVRLMIDRIKSIKYGNFFGWMGWFIHIDDMVYVISLKRAEH